MHNAPQTTDTELSAVPQAVDAAVGKSGIAAVLAFLDVMAQHRIGPLYDWEGNTAEAWAREIRENSDAG
jgi:hypothetical protein